jgi:hypothetical protein
MHGQAFITLGITAKRMRSNRHIQLQVARSRTLVIRNNVI